ncbi:MAG: polysaccharide biosynthesis C-terminal domain-containing protein [Bacteroidales bacterium]|nr:polysaccharide biosynthesis C-terminal domain-containing protein [Bacteroidales bacterium]
MKKNFLTGVGLIVLLNFIIKPVWVLGIERTVQNVVGASEFGFYFIIFSFSLIFNIILDFGLTNFNQRTISQHPQLLPKFLSGILSLKILLSLGYALILLLVALILRYDGREFHFLLVLGVNQILASYVLYMRSNITGMLLFKTDSVMSILDKLLMIIFCTLLLYGGFIRQPFKIEWFAYSQTASYLITAIIASIVVFGKTKRIKLTWNRALLLSLVKKTFPYALLSLLMSFYYRIDPMLMKEILPENIGVHEAGVYAMGYRLLDVLSSFSYLMSFFLLPLFARYIQLKQNLKDVITLAFSILITASVIAASACSFYAKELMDLMYLDNTVESTRVFQILIWGFVPISTSYVFGTLLTANGNLKSLNIIALVGITVNLLVNFLLIPRMMAVGSAFASLTTQLATVIVQLFVVRHIFKMNVGWNITIRLLSFIVGAVLICYGSKLLPLNPFVNFGIAITTSLLWAFLLKIITPTYVLRMWKEGE